MQRNYFQKVYAADDLLDADWKNRLTKIEILSRHHHFIPTITFSLSDAEHKLTYQQEWFTAITGKLTVIRKLLYLMFDLTYMTQLENQK